MRQRRIPLTLPTLLAAVLLAALPPGAAAVERLASQGFENERIALRVTPRTPDQVAAFYAARGFPEAMVELLASRCFLTVGLRNKGKDIVWHQLSNWHFSDADGPIAPYRREYWQRQWEAMDAPMASRATFRWTLMPEALDFRPDEAEGGNIILPYVAGPFRLEARFATGEQGDGPPIAVRVDNLRCAGEPR